MKDGRRRGAEPPDNPMGADRGRWAPIQRVHELCDPKVSKTARRLAKRAPR